MFWRKRKPQIDTQIPAPVNHLADQLDVERRFAVRILYPQAPCLILPAVYYNKVALKVHDISIGGCCLLDPKETLGAGVGNDIHLVLRWKDGAVSLHGRIVSRVDNKRHIRFLNLPKARAEELKIAVDLGRRAESVRSSVQTVDQGPTLHAREIWSSVHGDSVVIEDHIHRLAQITIGNTAYTLFKQAPPVKEISTPLSPAELSKLIVFLCNIPQPSELLEALIAHVESMAAADGQPGKAV